MRDISIQVYICRESACHVALRIVLNMYWLFYVTCKLFPKSTRALLRLERTMNLFGGREGSGRGGVGGMGEGGEGGEGGEEGMTVIHILIGMFNSNPMIPQYLNNNVT